MTDHEPDHPRSLDDDVDPAAVAWVEQALGDLSFLRPETPSVDADPGAMPDAVWERLQQTLAGEPPFRATARDDTDPATVVAGATAPVAAAVSASAGEVVSLESRRQPSRAARWAGGLVAASVAVVAVGVGVTAFQGSDGGGAIVAGDAPAATAGTEVLSAEESAAKSGASAEDGSELSMTAPSAGASNPASEADTSYAEGPQMMSFAGMVPPVLRLLQSDTDYTKSDLRGQVTDVLTGFGLTEPDAVVEAVADPEPTVEVPAEPMPGFTASPGFMATPDALRDCITKLTSEAKSTALLVDMATFDGQEAGVVVAPEYPMAEPAPQTPADWSTLEVWVVDPDCDITTKLRLKVVAQQ